MTEIINKLSVLLADTYALYLKTQNYHWHVTGPQFHSLHELFETQYSELANAVDAIAERIRILGHQAPATFKEFESLKRIKDGVSTLDSNAMLLELGHDHDLLINDLNQVIKIAEENHDEGTLNLLSQRIEEHEKARWMLQSSARS